MKLIAIAATMLLLSLGLGALTNAINSQVSPEYYVTILGWAGVQDIRAAAIAQGLFEASLYGAGLGVLFAVAVGWISRGTFTLRAVLPYLAGSALGALASWTLGGLFAMGLASLSPEFYRGHFDGVPEERGPMLCYAWVGGSIWGIEGGGIAAVLFAIVLFRTRIRNQESGCSPSR